MINISQDRSRKGLPSCSFGQGSSLLWTHALRPFVSRPIALRSPY